MSQITKEQVEHIAKLARIQLTPEEEEKMTRELGAILTYVEKLNEVDTTGVEPTAQVTGLENVMRPDVASEPDPQKAMDLIAAAPEREERHIRVREVFEK